jgi:hypothetical protein
VVPHQSVVVDQNQREGGLVGQLEVHSRFGVTCLLGPVSGSHILDLETVLDHLLSTDRVSSKLFAQFLRPLRANSIGLGIAYDCVQAFSGTVHIGLIKEELFDLICFTAICKPQTALKVDMGICPFRHLCRSSASSVYNRCWSPQHSSRFPGRNETSFPPENWEFKVADPQMGAPDNLCTHINGLL